MDVYYPHVLVTGNYKMVGNIARIPIKTDGDWSAALGKYIQRAIITDRWLF